MDQLTRLDNVGAFPLSLKDHGILLFFYIEWELSGFDADAWAPDARGRRHEIVRGQTWVLRGCQ